MAHKKQHFIPQSYLKAWCDPQTPPGQDPYVWQFSKDGLQVKKRAPNNIFYENNMYTIEQPDGKKNLVLEHGLSGLEQRFVRIRNNKIAKGKSLNQEEHIILCAFIAAMHGRTKAQRDHFQDQWGKLLTRMDEMTEFINKASPEEADKFMQAFEPIGQQKEGNTLSYEAVKELATHPIQTMLWSIIQAETPLLIKLDMAILETSESQGFITSDTPCVWFDPESCKRPPLYQAPALAFPTTEIRFPISPNQMILLNQKGFRRRILVPLKIVDELNRITRFSADEHFVVNQNVKKDFWFDPGIEPEDSWRKKKEQGL